MAEIKTSYSLNDMGVTMDDLILLEENGYSFTDTDNISLEKREEVLNKLYDLKHKNNANSANVSAPKDYDSAVEPATNEQIKQMKRELADGEHLDLQDMASAIKGSQIVSKDLRAELKNVIEGAVKAESLDREDIVALGYLLDELNGKHAGEKKNEHSVHEYRKQFEGTDLLEQATAKLEAAEKQASVYTKKDIEKMLSYGEMLEQKPEDVIQFEDKELQAATHNYHQAEFAAHVEKCSAFIKDFAEGRVTVDMEAMDAMEQFIDKYGKDYTKATHIKGAMSYDMTQDAANAMQRVVHERTEYGNQVEKELGLDKVKANEPKDNGNDVNIVEGASAEGLEVAEVADDELGYTKEELKAARKKAGKDRTVKDWKILYAHIDHNPELITDRDREKARKRLDEDFERTANKGVKKAWNEERGNGGKENESVVVIAPVNGANAQEKTSDPKDQGKPVDPKDQGKKPTDPKKKDDKDKKKKKGFAAWLSNAWDKTKKVAKKLVGPLLLVGLMAAGATKNCNGGTAVPGGNDGGDNDNKNKKEIVKPTPIKPSIEKDTVDLGMAHQYAKRMGYLMQQEGTDATSIEDAAIGRYLIDRGAYSQVKDKVAGHMGIADYSIDEQMAILATVCENTPKNKPIIEAMLNGKVGNIASIAKLKTETAKFKVNQETKTIEYTNPEQFTSQQGTKSIKVDKDKLAQKIKDNLYETR